MNRRSVYNLGGAALIALFVLMILPATTSAQRRWGTRPHRSRIVIYQPGPYVIYQRRPVYSYRYNTYSQPYYSSQYYPSGYSQPYYTNGYYSNGYTQYYSNGYTQPYVVNRYAYSPDYRYSYNTYRPRYQRNRFRLGIWLR